VLCDLNIAGTSAGSLNGKTFVVKDLFDVEGVRTGCGNPDWRSAQSPAVAHAQAVKNLLASGAILKGKACTDELALSLDGINPYYGIPLNTQLPDRIPGGSSSGSASAVAAGFVDFGLGTDTVGSIRVPASYCGIFGFRPTYGAIDTTGCQPLGPSFDTVAWLARDPDLLLKVGKVLLPAAKSKPIRTLMCPDNLFDLLPNEIAGPLLSACKSMSRIAEVNKGSIDISTLETCASIFGTIRSREAWQIYRAWIEKENPHLSPSTRQRLCDGKNVSAQQELDARGQKAMMTDLFDAIVEEGGAILLPSACGMPPLKSSTQEELDQNRKSNVRLTVLSPVCGLPQISIPVEISPGVKLGLSIMGPRGSDLDLLEFAKEILFEEIL
jgi:amidase